MDINDLKRVVVIGTSCSGKTTFANHLAKALGQKAIQLDALYWLPEWRPRPEHEFKQLVQPGISRASIGEPIESAKGYRRPFARSGEAVPFRS